MGNIEKMEYKEYVKGKRILVPKDKEMEEALIKAGYTLKENKASD